MRTFILATIGAFGVVVAIAFLIGWDSAMGDLEHVDGHAAGLTQSRQLGRPPVFFFSAAW